MSKTPKKTPKKRSDRVRRGGSWYYGPLYAQVAYRNYDAPDGRYYNLGFRLVEVLDEQDS